MSDELNQEITLQSLSEMLPIVMMFDASPWAIACVIGQLSHEEGVQSLPRTEDATIGVTKKGYRDARPVMFLSKVLDDTQSRWSQPEREAYAIFWFLTQNRHLLLGSKIYVYSDCKPITRAFRLACTNAKVNGWILSIQEFDYEIFHLPGKSNIIADCLSRVPKELLVKMEKEEQRALVQHHRDSMPQASAIRILRRHEELSAFPACDGNIGRLTKENWQGWRRAII